MNVNYKLFSLVPKTKEICLLLESLIRDHLENRPMDQHKSNRFVEIGKDIGLNYGHHITSRRCYSDLLDGTRYGVNIIKLEETLQQVLNMAKVIISANSILVIGNDIKISTQKNITIVPRYVPGVLTNKRYISSIYQTKYNVQLLTRYNCVIATKPKNSANVINEVQRINIKAKSPIQLVSFIDTNYKSNMLENIHYVIMNDENFVYKILLTHVFKVIMDIQKQKQSEQASV